MRLLEPEPSDFLSDERAKRYTYPAWMRLLRRVAGLFTQAAYYLGLDVSAWQLSLNAQEAHNAGMLFAFIRALYGLGVDKKFAQHWTSADGILPRGPYLYYLDHLDPYEQANKLFETCPAGSMPELPPVVDVEGINNATLTAAKIKQCVERVNYLFGDVMIYTGYYVWRDEVSGNKDWAAQYKLWIAGYPFSDWKPEYLELVKNYPPLIPAPWTQYAVWQFTSKLPAVAYGVSGTHLDGNYCTEPFAAEYLNGNPPPDPTPTGEPPLLQFKALTTVNIRSSPAVISSPSNDVGNMPTGAIVTAWAMRLFAGGSFWARIEPLPAWLTTTANEYWIALEYKAGNVLVDYTPAAPIPYLIKTASGNTPLYYWKDKNTSQKPIMVKPTDPPKFLAGKQVIVDPVEVDTDGTENYYRVLNGALATPPALTPPAPWVGWYCKVSEVF